MCPKMGGILVDDDSPGIAVFPWKRRTLRRKVVLATNIVSWYLGKFDHDLTTSEPWKSWFFIGESSPNGRKIQVSELW